ncbi:MAG: hypothetical protein LUC91_04140 [Prevotella sp.]|nr:hypothetical protein [Prevotella sp.]
MNKENDISEFEKLKASAEQGDAKAQYDLGICYYLGDGCSRNYKKAIKWWTLLPNKVMRML